MKEALRGRSFSPVRPWPAPWSGPPQPPPALPALLPARSRTPPEGSWCVPLDSRQPHFWKQASQAGSWRGQMAGGVGGVHREEVGPSSTWLACFKNQKASNPFPPMLPLWLGSDSILIIFIFIIPIKSALTHSNHTGYNPDGRARASACRQPLIPT